MSNLSGEVELGVPVGSRGDDADLGSVTTVVTNVGESAHELLDVERVTEMLCGDPDVTNNIPQFQEIFEFSRCEKFQLRVLWTWMDGHMATDDAIRSILTIWAESQESQGALATLPKLLSLLHKHHFRRTAGRLTKAFSPLEHHEDELPATATPTPTNNTRT